MLLDGLNKGQPRQGISRTRAPKNSTTKVATGRLSEGVVKKLAACEEGKSADSYLDF